MDDNINLENEIESEETTAEEEIEVEGIAMELLREFKENNKRMDEHNKRLISAVKTLSVSFAVTVVAIVMIFFIYMYQYDFQSYTQDGGGYNNINTGTQGDVNNGAEIPSTQEKRQ